MATDILLITPPFSQPNTPYPATAYLSGFLNTKSIGNAQADLGIELLNQLFSKQGLQSVFEQALTPKASENSLRMQALMQNYFDTIGPVMHFLQGNDPTLAHSISEGAFLPQASRFQNPEELDWAFGSMGVQDKAKHLATLYLEDLCDYITENIDPHFGFSRYAERLGRCAYEFDELDQSLSTGITLIDGLLLRLLAEQLEKHQPKAIGFSVPFPGNLYAALKCGQWLKQNHPDIPVLMGGGFPNTELRVLKDPRIFKYVDFISLDDGEQPLLCLLEHLQGKRAVEMLKRTFCMHQGQLAYFDGATEKDVHQADVGTPNYQDLAGSPYISVIEIANPMHRLWSDGRWNKLTLAHGCYWAKCSFCDTTLDYIARFQPNKAVLICDRMEEIIEQTGHTGIHFVDEAAPPALLKKMALEILKRGLKVSWWGNIRFEKSFTPDLCQLLKASGCIAVTGGLEVASPRILQLINKGVTVGQVASVANSFTESGIMVHAYLMYGFPSQTAQETIDALEMVRQLFENGALLSGFWHRFALTVHSRVSHEPEHFAISHDGRNTGAFANNDLEYRDANGCDHGLFSEGLRKSLFNYMHGVGFDFPLQDWFEHRVPPASMPPNFIEHAIEQGRQQTISNKHLLVWLGNKPQLLQRQQKKRGKTIKITELLIHASLHSFSLKVKPGIAEWLLTSLEDMNIRHGHPISLQQFVDSAPFATEDAFDQFWASQTMQSLREEGLLVLAP